MRASTNQVLTGTEEVVAEPLELHAGPLEMSLQGGKLREIRIGDVEIWHGLALVYRDPEWGTPAPLIERLDASTADDAFRVAFIGRVPIEPTIVLRVQIRAENRCRRRTACRARRHQRRSWRSPRRSATS